MDMDSDADAGSIGKDVGEQFEWFQLVSTFTFFAPPGTNGSDGQIVPFHLRMHSHLVVVRFGVNRTDRGK